MPTSSTPQSAPHFTPQDLIGRTVRIAREAHHIGLREMAAEVGVSPSHLSRVESGERVAGFDLIDRICGVIEQRAKKAS